MNVALYPHDLIAPADCDAHHFQNGYCARCDLSTERAEFTVPFAINDELGLTGELTCWDLVDGTEIVVLRTYLLGTLHGEQDSFTQPMIEKLQAQVDAWRAARKARAEWMAGFDRAIATVERKS